MATAIRDEQVAAPTRAVQDEANAQVSLGLIDALHPVGGPTELDRVQRRCQAVTLLKEVDYWCAVWREPYKREVALAHRRP